MSLAAIRANWIAPSATETNYAGTSFLTPTNAARYRYGSPHVNLVADNTEPGTLAATGYDDDGVPGCQKWDIVREASLSATAPIAKWRRIRGRTLTRIEPCRQLGSVPMVRIANIGLEPGPGHAG